jgi:uncharacterized membrane protein (DUF485 family)
MKADRGTARDRIRLQGLASIAVFDLAGPLLTYTLLRSAGQSAVSALVLSGLFPALGLGINLIRRQRPDSIGLLVLAGIVVGTIVGLASGNARLVLVEGSVPTAVFGLLCLGSLGTRRPLIYRLTVELIGAGTLKGRAFAARWRYPQFRRAFRLFTLVWGLAYLAEAAARVVIAEMTATGVALTVSKAMPYVVGAMLIGWMLAYIRRARIRSERQAAALLAACGPGPEADQARAEADQARAEAGQAFASVF